MGDGGDTRVRTKGSTGEKPLTLSPPPEGSVKVPPDVVVTGFDLPALVAAALGGDPDPEPAPTLLVGDSPGPTDRGKA
jgi:hypothetical protein